MTGRDKGPEQSGPSPAFFKHPALYAMGFMRKMWASRAEREFAKKQQQMHGFNPDPDYSGYCWVCGRHESQHD